MVTGTGEVVGMVANLKLIVEHGTFTTFMIVVSDSVNTTVKTKAV
jgi:sporulation protein YlmC with PRC-barrel domain